MITLKEWCQLHNRLDILGRWSDENDCGPSDVSFGSTRKIIWKCEEGHTWTATPNKITSRSSVGCPYCANQKVWAGYNDLQSKAPSIAAEWHPFKNNGLASNGIMPGSSKKVWWLCENNHEYLASVASRTSARSRCPYCSGKLVIPGETDLQTVFPNVAKDWDYQKNSITPDMVKPFSHKKAWWICPEGHSYETAISNRTTNSTKWKSNGCPYCSGVKVLKGVNDLGTRYPELSKKWHPTLNGELSPNDVGPFSTKKVWWIHGDDAKLRRIDSVVLSYLKQQKNKGKY